MGQWHYVDPNNGRQGPVEAKFIRDKLGSGELDSETLVWRKGMVAWQPTSAVQAQLADIAVKNGADAGLEGRATGADNEGIRAVITGNETRSPYATSSSRLSVGDGTVVAGEQVVYAGFWRRWAAYVVDQTLLNWLIKLLSMLIMGIFSIEPDPRTVGAHVTASVAISVLLVFGYYAGFHASRRQATLGKMIVGIKVVRTNGERLTLMRSVARVLRMSFLGAGGFMAGITKRKRALHDMVCDTLVVDEWAFTGKPKWQEKGLGIAATSILVMWGGAVIILLVPVLLQGLRLHGF